MAAQALITAHPCLRLTAGADGELGWKRHMGYKVASYRNNLANLAEVAINTGRRSQNNPDNDHPIKHKESSKS